MWFAFSTDLLKSLLGRPIVEHKKENSSPRFHSTLNDPMDIKLILIAGITPESILSGEMIAPKPGLVKSLNEF